MIKKKIKKETITTVIVSGLKVRNIDTNMAQERRHDEKFYKILMKIIQNHINTIMKCKGYHTK